MFLPNKYITPTQSYLGLSSLILDVLKNKKLTIEKLWTLFKNNYIESKKLKNPPQYQKFLYTLNFMFICNMINYNENGEIYNENLAVND